MVSLFNSNFLGTNLYLILSCLIFSCLFCSDSVEAFRNSYNQAPFRINSVPKITQKEFSSQLRRSKKKLLAYSVDGRPISNPLQPLSGYVLVQNKPTQEMTSGGVYIPSQFQEKQVIGQVLSVGAEAINYVTGAKIPMEISIGDWIIVGSHDGHKIKYNDKDCVIIRSEEILGKINDIEGTPNKKNITPIGDVALLKIDNGEEKTESGLILAKVDRKSPTEGFVVSTGKGAFDQNGQRIPMEIKPGDHVRFSSYMGDEMTMKLQDENYIFLRTKEILAKW